MFGGTLLLEKPQILNFILSASPNVHTYLLTRQCILCKEAPLCNMEFYIVPSGDEIGHRLSILRKQWKERGGRENSQRWKCYVAATEICLHTVHGMQRIYMAVA